MYDIIFYEDKNGYSEVVQFIRQLNTKSKNSKDTRINLNKITAYIDLLAEEGTRIGEPVTKHLDGVIWELRPLKNRILYAYYKENQFIILSHFKKKTRKTPISEIEKAKRYLNDFLERND